MEEVRAIKNVNLSKRGKEVENALKKLGDGQIIKMLWGRRPVDELKDRMEELRRIKCNQNIQKDWTKVEASSYCKYYKNIKINVKMESYLRRKDLKNKLKETWARWRCENVLKENKKGWEDLNCRGCNGVPEKLEHVIDCKIGSDVKHKHVASVK